MPVGSTRAVSPLVAVALAVAGLGALSGCGGVQERDGGSAQEDTRDREARAHRARQVAAAWDGSATAAAWRVGYHPLGPVTQLPRGGLRSKADKRAYQNNSFVLRTELPAAGPGEGRAVWDRGGSLTLPQKGAEATHNAPATNRAKPQLTVTGAKLGEMNVATSRGPAKVPAWLFSLEGYDSPLKRAAVTPSKLPRAPIERTRDVPGNPVRQLVRISADGRSVTVVALHGACDDGAVVDVLETSGSVVLSGSIEGQRGGLCTKEARSQQVTVELDRPLGHRVPLDALTGQPVRYKPGFGPLPDES